MSTTTLLSLITREVALLKELDEIREQKIALITAAKAKAAPAVTLNKPRVDYAMDYLLELSSTVKGDEYNQVTYLVREAGKKWLNIGTSDHRTVKSNNVTAGLYRVYIEPRKYAKGTNLEFVSIVKNAANKTAVSKIVKYKVEY